MKSISLYVDKDTYLTRMHPFAKLCYIFTAIVASLVAGSTDYLIMKMPRCSLQPAH